MPPIKRNDVVDKSVEKAFIDLNKALGDTVKLLSTLVSEGKELNDALKSSTGLKAYNDNLKKLNTSRKTAAELTKDQANLLKQEEQLKQQVAKTTAAQERAIQAKNRTQIQESKELDRLIKLEEKELKQKAKLTGAYARQSKALTLLRTRAKNLAITYGESSNQFLQAEKRVVALDSKLKNLDARLGQSGRVVGQYERGISKVGASFRNLAGAFGFVGGIQLFAKTLISAISTARKFEKQSAVLASVLGKTKDQIKNLTDEAARLGSETPFTSTEILKLQTELARLGKTEEEIIAMTGGVVNATIALGSETSETATLVAATLNTFELSADKSTQVADVLTLSTQRTAASFESLNTSIPIAAGAAAAAKVPFEKMVAQLGQAADRGIDASTAATSLRNIYITLADKGITLSEALSEINSSQDKLSTANELFGKRAAVTALALANTTDKTDDLEKALRNAGGTAQKVADEQMKTFDGQIKSLSSAYEGLILSLTKTETATKYVAGLSAALRNLTNSFKTGIESGGELATGIIATISSSSETAEEKISKLSDAIERTSENIKTDTQIRDENNAILAKGAFRTKKLKEDRDAASKSIEKNNEVLRVLNQELKSIQKEQDIDNKQLALKNKTLDELIAKQALYIESENSLSEGAKNTLEAINRELAAREKSLLKKEEEKEVTSDLIEIQKILLEQAKEMPGTTEAEITARNKKVASIEREISRLEKLGELQKPKPLAEIKIKEFDDSELEAANDKEIADYLAKEEEKTRILAEEEAKRKEIRQVAGVATLDIANTIAQATFENAQTRREEETQAELLAYDERLNNEKLSEDQRAQIEKEKTQREKELRKRNAVANKRDSLFQVGINTLVGISKTFATLGFPAGVVPAGILAAQGAVQAAIIAARPIPQFDKGTNSLPELSEVAEKRPEFVISKNGVELFDKPTILGKEYKGSKVIGGSETAQLLEQANRQAIMMNVTKSDDDQLNKAIIRAFGKHTDKVVAELQKNRPIKQNHDIQTELLRHKLRN